MKMLEKMQTASLICALALMFLVQTVSATEWSVSFRNEIDNNHSCRFSLGVADNAKDGYDTFCDAIRPNPPSGEHVKMITSVDNNYLKRDYKKTFEGTRTWEIYKITEKRKDGRVEYSWPGFSGTDSLTWNLRNVPDYVELTLVDHGTDITRNNEVETIDMKEVDSYDIEITDAVDLYRVLSVIATSNPPCVEDWSCSPWSACNVNQKTRTCIDNNDCQTTEYKPPETESCSENQPRNRRNGVTGAVISGDDDEPDIGNERENDNGDDDSGEANENEDIGDKAPVFTEERIDTPLKNQDPVRVNDRDFTGAFLEFAGNPSMVIMAATIAVLISLIIFSLRRNRTFR